MDMKEKPEHHTVFLQLRSAGDSQEIRRSAWKAGSFFKTVRHKD